MERVMGDFFLLLNPWKVSIWLVKSAGVKQSKIDKYTHMGFWIVKPPKVRKPVALQPLPVIVEQNHKRYSTNSAPGPGIQRSNRSLEPME